MMQAMRNQVKAIYWVVIATFVGLMFLVWGVGLDNTDPNGDQGSSGAVAVVNGQEISFEDWQARANSIMASQRQQQGNNAMTENQRIRAEQQAFDALVRETLQQMEAEKLGISVTDEEIVDLLSNRPPDFLTSQFMDANGQINYDAYYAALNDPSINWPLIENVMRESIPVEKLTARIAGRAVVSETEIRDAFHEEGTRVVAEYVGVSFSDIDLPEETPADDVINRYYQDHLDDYKLPERSTVRMVSLPKVANDEDEAQIRELLDDIRKEITNGESDFAGAATSYSEDPSSTAGGALGFIDRNRMSTEFTDAAFALPVGDISGPVKTPLGFHLIQVTDEKLDDDGKRTEVLASHLLLKATPSEETIRSMRERFETFHDKATSQGLDAAAAESGFEVVTSEPFQEGLNIPGITNSLAGATFAFANEPGTLSPVFESSEVLYAIEVAERIPAGHRPLADVRSLVEGAVKRDQRADQAAEQLAAVWADIQGGKSFEEAAKNTVATFAVTDTFTLRQNIPNVGFNTAFARAAASMDVGDTLPEVRTPRGVYALRVLWKSEFDQNAFDSRRAQLGSSLLYNRQRQLVTEWLKQLEESASIEDRRADFM